MAKHEREERNDVAKSWNHPSLVDGKTVYRSGISNELIGNEKSLNKMGFRATCR
ncbi:MAG: hypothetical protein ACLRV7_00410 [Hoylesella buccalis]